jgi:hypothetical protein
MFFWSVFLGIFLSLHSRGSCLVLKVEDGISKVNEIVKLPIIADNPSQIAGWVFTLTYDTDALELIQLESDAFSALRIGGTIPGTGTPVCGVRIENSSTKPVLMYGYFLVKNGVKDVYQVGMASTIVANPTAGYSQNGEAVGALRGIDPSKTPTDPLFCPALASSFQDGKIWIDHETAVYVDSSGNCGGRKPCHSSVQSALQGAGSGSHIMAAQGEYIEAVEVVSRRLLHISTGYDLGYADRSGVSLVRGMTIKDGILIIEGLTLGETGNRKGNDIAHNIPIASGKSGVILPTAFNKLSPGIEADLLKYIKVKGFSNEEKVDDQIVLNDIQDNLIDDIILRFYRTFLRREPESWVFDFWKEKYFLPLLNQGIAINYVIWDMGMRFILSSEYGLLCYDQRQLTLDCYYAFLGRYPSEEELQHYTTGDDKWRTLLAYLVTSDELRDLLSDFSSARPGDQHSSLVTYLTLGLVGKLPENMSLSFWKSQLDLIEERKEVVRNLVSEIVHLEEFRFVHKDEKQIVCGLFEILLGREPEQYEGDQWINRLRNGFDKIDELGTKLVFSNEASWHLSRLGLFK